MKQEGEAGVGRERHYQKGRLLRALRARAHVFLSFSLSFSIRLSLLHTHPQPQPHISIHTPDENVKGTVEFNGIKIRVYDSCRAKGRDCVKQALALQFYIIFAAACSVWNLCFHKNSSKPIGPHVRRRNLYHYLNTYSHTLTTFSSG